MAGVSARSLAIVGAGGFGREVLDIVDAINQSMITWDFRGFLDDATESRDELIGRGFTVIGTPEKLTQVANHYVVAVGDGSIRESIVSRLSEVDALPATLVHPSSTQGAMNRVGVGCVLTAGTRLTTNVSVGVHVHINLNSTVGHDTVIDDFVTIFPGVTISGGVRIGKRSTIGTGANILPGVAIGEDCYVGAGAVVTKDVSDGLTVVGVPARVVPRG